MVYFMFFFISENFVTEKIHYKNVLKNFRWSDILRTGSGTKTGSILCTQQEITMLRSGYHRLL